MNNYHKLRELVNSLEGDFESFFSKGNKAAGTRVRKGMQEVKAMAQSIRVAVSSQKKAE